MMRLKKWISILLVVMLLMPFGTMGYAEPGDKELRVDPDHLSVEDSSDAVLTSGKVTLEEVLYTVTFNSQGGSEVAEIADVTSGKTISEPPAPTKAGYTFEGWYTEAAGHAWDFEENKVTSDLTLYANWTRHSAKIKIGSVSGSPGTEVNVPVTVIESTYGISAYNLVIDFDEETLKILDEITDDDLQWNVNNDAGSLEAAWFDADDAPMMEGDTLFTLPFLIKEGAELGDTALTVDTDDLFVWDSSAEKMEITLIPGKVTVALYTVTFDSQGGSAVKEIADVTSGTTINKPQAPTKAGYTFEGWYTEAEEGSHAWDFEEDKVTSDLTLYAKWTRHSAEIEIGSVSGKPGTKVSVPVTVTESTYGISKYDLQIDFDEESLEISGITGNDDRFQSNKNNDAGWLEALWKDHAGDSPMVEGDTLFTVTFDIKEDAEPGDTALTVDTDDLSVWDWSAEEMEITLIPGKVTVEAKQYTVAFDSQGGSEVDDIADVTSGTTINKPQAPTKAGYTFEGWYTEAEEGSHAWDFEEDKVTSDLTLYAKWTRHSAEIKIGSVSGKPGTEVSVPVTVYASTYGISAYDLQIDFDKDSLEVSGVTGNLETYYDSHYDNQAGWIKTSWIDSNAGDTPIMAGETLFTVTFIIKDNSKPGDKALTVQTSEPGRFSFTDAFNVEMKKTLISGKVTVENPGNPNPPVTPGNPGTPSVPSNPSTPSVPSNPGTPNTPAPVNPPGGLQVIVNGVVKDQIAAGVTTNENGKSVLTATIDPAKLADQLNQSADKSRVVIPVTANVDKVMVLLTGEAVKGMENKQAVLEIQTPIGTYKLPAGQIAIDNISSKLGEQVKLSDIVVHVEITKSGEAAEILARAAAAQGSFEVAAPPVTFNVTASYNGSTVSVDQFSSYVEREIPLPAGLDHSKVTTAAVLNSDGSVRHVPTYITTRNGNHFAVVNSLTNSDYFLIWNPKTFADVEGHWSKQAVNDMASRMIVKGMNENQYNPNAVITRAELAAIVVRALGLEENSSSASFSDVKPGDWYAGAVGKAAEYGLIEGYDNGTFAPNRTITRQEALVIMARAMKEANLQADEVNADSVLSPFADQAQVAPWAKPAMAAAVKFGLVQGSNKGLMPAGNLTRAETAAIVQRFLMKASLIDNGNNN
ncbi:InlB B-repeat-containing protein [Paenibacillus lemnae]|uniref:SLH domain-containing protein n=1 Tax=Paenibacillus lemnae TaxID=1330551 RepID=A0A848M3Z6_PAELE|nr:InlB B-repeat-containing protein [Paenibacillus lemnae]NMO94940.1 hypothetical protein [Paenibacillus lemnae]